MLAKRSYSFLLACAALTVAAVAGVRGSEIPGSAFDPGVSLPRPARGLEAVQLLGADFEKVAALNGYAPVELRNALVRDRDLHVDTDGRLTYHCAGLHDHGVKFQAKAKASAPKNQASKAPPFPQTDTFKLHSRKVSTKTIYLDFNGHRTLDGQGWNNDQAFDSPGWTLDGDRTAYNVDEHEVIQRSWQAVSEDFAPFDVDVTTEDPGIEKLRRTSAGDQEYGIRVVISENDLPAPGAGGVAFLTSFQWADDVPCYTFTNWMTGNNDSHVDAIAAVTSHEVGHTLGLNHDGQGSLEYYDGQGNWGPIMGTPYGKPISQWSNGDYGSSTNQENDVVVMRNFGAATLVDDFDDTLAKAFFINGSSVRINGFITTRSDTDLFKFDTGNGPVTITASLPAFRPNVDVKLELISATNTVLATASPVAVGGTINVGAAFTQNLPLGTYYLRIDGVGDGNPLTTGYSDYGSIGTYSIDFTLQTSVAPVAPSNLQATAINSGLISLTWSDNSPNESSFEIERSTDNVNFVAIGSVGGGISTANDTNVNSGVTYYYRVRAVNAAGASEYSNVASATPPYDPPTAPSLASVTVLTPTSVEVDWFPGTGAIDTYEVERRLGNGAYGAAGTVPSTTTVLTDGGLVANATYTYRVRSVGPGGVSEWSNEISVTLPPSEPTNLQVEGLSGGFRLTWEHPGNVGYRIERKVGNGPFVQIAQVIDGPNEVEEFTNSGFLPGVTARFRVRSFTSAGVSLYSNEASATTVAGVTSFSFAKPVASSGQTVRATVEIGPAAPEGGTTVALTGSKLLELPRTVRVPRGASSVSFNVKVKSVSKTQLVNAKAAFGGAERSATITLRR